MFNVFSLPLRPFRLRIFKRVAAITDNICYAISKALTYFSERCFAALILRAIMQKRGNRLVFASAGFHHDACDC